MLTPAKRLEATGPRTREAEPSQVRWIDLKELRRLEMEALRQSMQHGQTPSSIAPGSARVSPRTTDRR